MCIKKITDILVESCTPGGRRPPPHNRGPPPPSPQGGGNQSCLTTDIGFHSECRNMIPVRSKKSTNAIRERVAWWRNKMAQERWCRVV